jgi:hypothetical protein
MNLRAYLATCLGALFRYSTINSKRQARSRRKRWLQLFGNNVDSQERTGVECYHAEKSELRVRFAVCQIRRKYPRNIPRLSFAAADRLVSLLLRYHPTGNDSRCAKMTSQLEADRTPAA